MSKNKPPLVIKLGGKFFDLVAQNSAEIDNFFQYLKILNLSHRRFLLVHGGGNQVTTLLAQLGRESLKHEGLRITPDGDIDVVTGVLAGHLNKRLSASLKAAHIDAAGISLVDANLATCKKVSDSLGWVGEPVDGDIRILTALFSMNIVPVVASIGGDYEGNLYNVNADHAALHIAQLLNAELMLLSDVPGVLDSQRQLIDELDSQSINMLAHTGVITDGMLLKVKAAKSAADRLQRPVTIASWTSCQDAVSLDSLSIGTKILPDTQTQLA